MPGEDYIRQQMIMLRSRDVSGEALCDFCSREVGGERHHIITKYRTMGSEQAKALANQPHMTALLCRSCHDIADNIENRDVLWQRLYVINGRGDAQKGYELIKQTYEEIKNLIWLPWALPSPSYLRKS